MSELLRARYRMRLAPGESAELRARQLAREQTLEAVEGIVAPELEARALGRVERLVELGDGRVDAEIGFPVAVAGGELPQLLNLLYGNVSLWPGIRLEEVTWPEALLEAFPGPAFGAAGLRALCGAPPDRPLVAAVLKPIGLPARELARLAAECALGGLDLVKDDHSLADQMWAPFRERVHLVAEHVARANRRTGGCTIYAPSLSGPVDRLAERLETLAEAGCRAALVAPLVLGLDTVRALAATSGIALIAHPTFSGAFLGREHGIAPGVLFGDLFRIAGADAVISAIPGGRFPVSEEEVAAIARRLAAPLGALRPAMLALGGGIDAERLAHLVPRFGPDTLYLAGSGLFARPGVREASGELAALVGSVAARLEL